MTRFEAIEQALIKVLDHLGLEHAEGSVSEPKPVPDPTVTVATDSPEVAALKQQLAEALAANQPHETEPDEAA